MSPRRRLTDVRRQQILEAAVRVIAERGICDTRISDVAHLAGTSPSLILYYFTSKDRLLADALTFQDQRFYDQIAVRLATVDRARDRLILMIEASCPPNGKEPQAGEDWVLWLDMWTRARRDPEIARDRESLDRRWRDAIAEVVREGQRAGDFAPTDPVGFALHLSALMDGLAIQVLLEDPAVSADRMREVSLKMAARELGFDLPRRRASKRV